MQPSKELIASTKEYLALELKVKMLNIIVTNIQIELLEGFGSAILDRNGVKIVDPKYLYLSTDQRIVTKYFKKLSLAYKNNGYKIVEGECPLLIEENKLRLMGNKILDLAVEFHGQSCLMSSKIILLKHREQILSLTLKYVSQFL